MKFRQVHLDFHTSEHIEKIGQKFNKEQFQNALRVGHVNSITLFSKCHHGWSYHPTTVGKMHPQLDFDLLGAQIEAAHEIGVNAVVYLSAGLDEQLAVRHPEWLIRNKDESTTWAPDFKSPGYHKFCMNTPYLDYLCSQVKEAVTNYDADGIFMDITGVSPCFCHSCLAKRRAEGLDPFDDEASVKTAEEIYAKYTTAIRNSIDEIKPGLPLFHNGGHIRCGRRDLAQMNTHLEIESLPTGGWGYDHFPLTARYVQGIGMEYLGMTGKFHSTWGEFGGFKHPNALKYEVCLSAANGAKCSIGDQLHPNGCMDMATYELIGAAYSDLEKKEEWIDNVEAVADIGVLSYEAVSSEFSTGQTASSNDIDSGVVRILLEGNYLFDILDYSSDFSKYKVIILPDNIKLNEKSREVLKNYTAGGGKILATGKSGLFADENNFALDFGAEYISENNYKPSYFSPEFETEDIKKTAYVFYSCGEIVKSCGGEVLAKEIDPYFNRTVEHFSSHQHAPNSENSSGIGMIKGEDGIYIAWQIFSDYAQRGNIIYKQVVCYALDKLLGDNKTIQTNLPAQGVVTLMRQHDKNRYVCHMLYAAPVKRGNGVEVIEDIIPVYNINVAIKLPVKKAYLAPSGENVEFTYKNGLCEIKNIAVNCHQMIVFEV